MKILPKIGDKIRVVHASTHQDIITRPESLPSASISDAGSRTQTIVAIYLDGRVKTSSGDVWMPRPLGMVGNNGEKFTTSIKG